MALPMPPVPPSSRTSAVAANSSTITNDDLAGLAGAVYQTLHKAGAVPTS